MAVPPAPSPVALKALLDRYGLGSLAAWADQVLIQNLSEEEILLQLYDRPEFKAAFPEIEARQKRAMDEGISLRPISAEDVINMRSTYRQMLRSYSAPPGLWDSNDDFFQWIVGDKSPSEVEFQLKLATERVYQAAPEVRQMFDELTGNQGDTALFAFFLDDQKAPAVLEEMVQQAEAGGAARRFGFNLSRPRIEELAAYNVDYGQALTGFAQLDEMRGLFEETLYEAVDYKAEEEGVEATFGLGPGAAEKLQRRAGERTAQTAGAAGGVREERGATSLGGAGRR